MEYCGHFCNYSITTHLFLITNPLSILLTNIYWPLCYVPDSDLGAEDTSHEQKKLILTWIVISMEVEANSKQVNQYIYKILLKVKVKSLSRVWLFATLWTVAYQVPLLMGFSSQEYWSGLPFPSPGDLPNPGIEPKSPALYADALPSEPPDTFRWC